MAMSQDEFEKMRMFEQKVQHNKVKCSLPLCLICIYFLVLASVLYEVNNCDNNTFTSSVLFSVYVEM